MLYSSYLLAYMVSCRLHSAFPLGYTVFFRVYGTCLLGCCRLHGAYPLGYIFLLLFFGFFFRLDGACPLDYTDSCRIYGAEGAGVS